MQYCKKCKVNVSGAKRKCPLCQSSLTGEPNEAEEIFPVFEKPKYSDHFLVRLITFIAISAAVIVVALDWMIPSESHWSYFVVVGIFCALVCILFGIARRHNVIKKISMELFIVTLLAIGWDYFTGWRGWSIEYILPCGCAAAIIATYVLSKIFKPQAMEAFFHLIINSVYGIVPIFFILTDKISVTYPSVICVALSILSVSGILLFDGRNIRGEISRRLHL